MSREEGSPGLRSVVARGAAVTVVGQILRTVLQLVGIVVLARLLTPGDYGVLAMVVAVFGVGEILRDFGLASAMVQAKVISRAQRTNLFWLTTSLGGLLTLVTFMCAPLLELVYGTPAVVDVARLLSISFLINGASSAHRADLTRSLRFGWLVIADVGGQAVGIAVGIAAAVAGAGTQSLVWMSLTQALVGFAVCVTACRWLPGLPVRGESIRSFINFGVGVASSQVLAYGAKNADAVLIGALLGTQQLGFYSRAMQLLFLPVGQLQAPATRVALPILAQVADDPPEFDRRLLRAQTTLMHGIALVIALGAGLAPPLVLVALGDQWDEAAPILRIISVGGFAYAATYSAYWVFVARALTRPLLIFSLWARPLTILCLCGGAWWGVEGVAIAFSLNALLNWPLNFWWISRYIEVPAKRLVQSGLRLMLMYGGCAVVAGFVVDSLASGGTPVLAQLAVGAVVLVGAVALIGAIHGATREELRDILRTAVAARSNRV